MDLSTNSKLYPLFEITGKQISLGSFDLSEGVQEIEFDLTPYNLKQGLYYLSVENGQFKKNVKLAIK